MKHILGFAVVLLSCAGAAQAQPTSGGVRAGLNLANLSFSSETEVNDSKTLAGLVAGAFATVSINEMIAFQPEVLFSQQGTKLTDGSQTATFKLDYVQVPLLGRFRVMKGSPVGVLVGPSLGFRTRARIDAPGAPDEFSEAFEDEIKRFDVGLVTGIGVDVGHFVLDGRYTWGLMNIAKDTSEPGSAKHRVFSATAGIRF